MIYSKYSVATFLLIQILANSICFATTHNAIDIYLPAGSQSAISYDISANNSGLIVAVGAVAIAGQTQWTVRLSKNNGGTWNTVDQFLPMNGVRSLAHAVAINSQNWIYVGGQVWSSDGTSAWFIRRSKNKGRTWSTVDTYSYGIGDNQLFRLVPDRLDRIWAVGSYFPADPGSGPIIERGLIRRSTANGNSWSLIDAELRSNYFALDFDKENNVYVAGLRETTGESDPDLQDFALYTKKSATSGQTWTTLDLYSFPGFVGGALNILVDKKEDIWTVGNGWDQNAIRRAVTRSSHDAGQSWADVDTYSLSASGASEIYAVRELQNSRKVSAGYAIDTLGVRHLIYRISNNTGTSWQTLVDDIGTEGLGAFPQQMIHAKQGALLTAGGVVCASPCQRKWAVFKLIP